ncbi:deoxyribodipyrimidine photolyase [candidate division GN15 bacterium]|nr:deoxyribodipyrimidine photolyase [candidate division GN15 bacterium]
MDPADERLTARRSRFLLDGLKEVEADCRQVHIPLLVFAEPVEQGVPVFIEKHRIGALVTDMAPLRSDRAARQQIGRRIDIPSFEVDAHNIVPARFVSDKQEYAAYTIRPKINAILDEFLTEFPPVVKQETSPPSGLPANDWSRLSRTLAGDQTVAPVDWARGGTLAGLAMLEDFIENRLAGYHDGRNDPTRAQQSDLSPWLNFGFLSAQRAALAVQRVDRDVKSQEAFLEEMIVRRELSDNFCLYNDAYDSFTGFPEWAQQSLKEHQQDPREYLYSLQEFEAGETHDDLWNAAQWEMVYRGKMHGYLRMYWAKKILEWTATPEDALRIANYLNDRYELDGCDPNGYTGTAWSIGGVHDRPWFEREIFGKIRFMSYNGCKRKFDIDTYVTTIRDFQAGALS